MRVIIAILLGILLTVHAGGQQLVTENKNEPRVRELASILRCPVCQSENILDSQASIAQEMLFLLREQIEAGATDDAIILFFRERYGDYVLLEPATNGPSLFLWVLPFGFGFLFIFIAYRLIKAMHRDPPSQKDVLDEQRLDEMEV
ncbi:cytochrome c-type biogenesis protein [Lentilitoribacter sp. EG35]|jgi:cytochrome c-type biogenesis protein CcmH|uniref:cytochrome c-type biogenesis protein n=1 Tax=Lentilitoribacter sp. EG35 TaxID=3234192 RepID=UPI00345F355B